MRSERWWSVILSLGLFMVLSPLSAQAGPNRSFTPQGNRQAFAPPQPRGHAPTSGIGSRITISSLVAMPTAGMARTVSGISLVAMLTAGMAITVRGISPTAMPTAGMAIIVRGTSPRQCLRLEWSSTASGTNTGMPMGGMITSGNRRAIGVSIIILVLPIIVPAIRPIRNLPILPPIRQAIPIIPPSRRVRLASGPVSATPMLPGIPLSRTANLLQG